MTSLSLSFTSAPRQWKASVNLLETVTNPAFFIKFRTFVTTHEGLNQSVALRFNLFHRPVYRFEVVLWISFGWLVLDYDPRCCSSGNGKCWRHFLKDVELGSFEPKNKVERPLPWKTLVLDLLPSIGEHQGVYFKFKWWLQMGLSFLAIWTGDQDWGKGKELGEIVEEYIMLWLEDFVCRTPKSLKTGEIK